MPLYNPDIAANQKSGVAPNRQDQSQPASRNCEIFQLLLM